MSATAPLNPLGNDGNLHLAREAAENAQKQAALEALNKRAPFGNQPQAPPIAGAAPVAAVVQQPQGGVRPGMVPGQGGIGTGPGAGIGMGTSQAAPSRLPSQQQIPGQNTAVTTAIGADQTFNMVGQPQPTQVRVCKGTPIFNIGTWLNTKYVIVLGLDFSIFLFL